MEKFYNQLKELKVVPVVVIKNIEDTIPTLKGLKEGNLPVAEITFRTVCASDAIALGVKEFPEMMIGAGTIINKNQAKLAIKNGGKNDEKKNCNYRMFSNYGMRNYDSWC